MSEEALAYTPEVGYEASPITKLKNLLESIAATPHPDNGKPLIPGGVVMEHQTPTMTPAIILEIPDDYSPTSLGNSQTYDALMYKAYVHVIVQGRNPLLCAIDCDNIAKFIRLKIKEAEYYRTLDGIKMIKTGTGRFYGVEEHAQGALMAVALRQQVEWMVMEDFEELAPLVETLYNRQHDWEKENLLKETITSAEEEGGL